MWPHSHSFIKVRRLHTACQGAVGVAADEVAQWTMKRCIICVSHRHCSVASTVRAGDMRTYLCVYIPVGD